MLNIFTVTKLKQLSVFLYNNQSNLVFLFVAPPFILITSYHQHSYVLNMFVIYFSPLYHSLYFNGCLFLYFHFFFSFLLFLYINDALSLLISEECRHEISLYLILIARGQKNYTQACPRHVAASGKTMDVSSSSLWPPSLQMHRTNQIRGEPKPPPWQYTQVLLSEYQMPETTCQPAIHKGLLCNLV